MVYLTKQAVWGVLKRHNTTMTTEEIHKHFEHHARDSLLKRLRELQDDGEIIGVSRHPHLPKIWMICKNYTGVYKWKGI